MTNTTNINEQGVALQGYDPVSYFADLPVVGNPEIHSTYESINYYNKAEVSLKKYLDRN